MTMMALRYRQRINILKSNLVQGNFTGDYNRPRDNFKMLGTFLGLEGIFQIDVQGIHIHLGFYFIKKRYKKRISTLVILYKTL